MYKKERKGFTLIELLVVISIIGLLSSVVIASMMTARMKARDAKRIDDLSQIKIALEMYHDANAKYPNVYGQAYNTNTYTFSHANTGWNDLATKLAPYIKPLPKDPINSVCSPWTDGCYSYAYGNVADGSTVSGINYDLTTQLETPNHPQSCGAGNNYRFHFNSGILWCGAYSKQIYEASPM